MVLWFAVETIIAAVGVYNISKGVYNMYRDAEEIKKDYREHKRTAEEYRIAQLSNREDSLTESQYSRHEENFVLLNKSTILDKNKV